MESNETSTTVNNLSHLNSLKTDEHIAKVLVIRGNDIHKSFELLRINEENSETPADTEFITGRDESCDIYLDDLLISRKHARIFSHGYKFYLDDIQSTNGTFLNDERVNGIVRLRNQDRISIGNTVLKFIQDDIEADFYK